MARPTPTVPRLVPGSPPELIVYDKPQRCPYLPGRLARMPLRLPARSLDPSELDDRLDSGDRRQGFVLYRTHCPNCSACEPIRLDAHHFEPNRSQRRAFQRGEGLLRVQIGPPLVDAQHVALYNKHKLGRGLNDGQPSIDAEGYRDFLVSSCCESFEMRYYRDDSLVGVAIVDRGRQSLSAVYCYYDPECSEVSLGTYSILKQLSLCRAWGLRHLYLGLYIEKCEAMVYKSRYVPHERLIDGRWVSFDRPKT